MLTDFLLHYDTKGGDIMARVIAPDFDPFDKPRRRFTIIVYWFLMFRREVISMADRDSFILGVLAGLLLGGGGRLIRTWSQCKEVIFMGSVLGTIIRILADRDWSGLFPWKEVIKLKKFSFSGIYSERWWYHEQDHKSRSTARRFSAPLGHFLVIFLWFHVKEVIFMSAGVLTAIIGAAATVATAIVNSNSDDWTLVSGRGRW